MTNRVSAFCRASCSVSCGHASCDGTFSCGATSSSRSPSCASCTIAHPLPRLPADDLPFLLILIGFYLHKRMESLISQANPTTRGYPRPVHYELPAGEQYVSFPAQPVIEAGDAANFLYQYIGASFRQSAGNPNAGILYFYMTSCNCLEASTCYNNAQVSVSMERQALEGRYEDLEQEMDPNEMVTAEDQEKIDYATFVTLRQIKRVLIDANVLDSETSATYTPADSQIILYQRGIGQVFYSRHFVWSDWSTELTPKLDMYLRSNMFADLDIQQGHMEGSSAHNQHELEFYLYSGIILEIQIPFFTPIASIGRQLFGRGMLVAQEVYDSQGLIPACQWTVQLGQTEMDLYFQRRDAALELTMLGSETGRDGLLSRMPLAQANNYIERQVYRRFNVDEADFWQRVCLPLGPGVFSLSQRFTEEAWLATRNQDVVHAIAVALREEPNLDVIVELFQELFQHAVAVHGERDRLPPAPALASIVYEEIPNPFAGLLERVPPIGPPEELVGYDPVDSAQALASWFRYNVFEDGPDWLETRPDVAVRFLNISLPVWEACQFNILSDSPDHAADEGPPSMATAQPDDALAFLERHQHSSDYGEGSFEECSGMSIIGWPFWFVVLRRMPGHLQGIENRHWNVCADAIMETITNYFSALQQTANRVFLLQLFLLRREWITDRLGESNLRFLTRAMPIIQRARNTIAA